MSKPRRIRSYPSQLLQLVLEFEAREGEPTTIEFEHVDLAYEARSELYGLRAAIEKEGEQATYPHFMGVRIFLKERKLTLVSADKLPFAKALGTILSNG